MGSEKLPLGALQTALVAAPANVPFKVTKLPPHTVCGVPAFTVALGSIVTTKVNGLPGHPVVDGVTV